jgi:hypothetical protein
MVERVNGEGGTYTVALEDDDGRQVQDPELVAVRDDLIARINGLVIPDAPLTILFEHFGSERIAEVTGRKRRLVRKLVDGAYVRQLEDRSGDASALDTAAFQAGEKDILVFSEGAGGTGRSYHADRNCGNQKKREHIVLQVGWRSDKAAQGLGRTLRTNSVSDPRWTLATTNVPGEKRFFSTIARRMEDLGAASRGQRDAVNNGIFTAADNLESTYGQLAVTSLLHDIVTNNQPISYRLWLDQTNAPLLDGKGNLKPLNVPRFLNKVLTCDLNLEGTGPQNLLMDALTERMEQQIQVAKDRGVYDEGVTTLKALSVSVAKREMIFTSEDGAATELVTLNVVTPSHKRSFSEVLVRIRNARERFGAHDAKFGKTQEGDVVALYRIADVSLGGVPKACYTIADPARTYTVVEQRPWFREVTDAEAEGMWKAQLATIEDTVTTKHPLVTGTILPIFHALPNQRLNVVKIRTDEDERLIGIMLRSDECLTLLERLGMNNGLTLENIVEEILNNRKTGYYADWSLVAVRLASEKRLELRVPPYIASSLVAPLSAAGMECERISYQHRFLVPQTDSLSVLERALAGRMLTALS